MVADVIDDLVDKELKALEFQIHLQCHSSHWC